MNIDTLLGNKAIAEQIDSILLAEPNSQINISGSEGRGKTWITYALDENLTSQNYCFIHLHGDLNRKQESFYPLKQFIEKKDKTFNKGVIAIKESIGQLPYVGKTLKALVEDYDFKKHKVRNSIQDISPFKDNIDFSIHLIGLEHKYEKIIIVCDNIDYFDQDTIRYLTSLTDGFLQFKGSSIISFVTTGNNQDEALLNFGYRQRHSIKLPPLSDEQIRDTLEIWSNKTVNDEQLKLIISCTGAHLQLLKIVANYLIESDLSPSSGGNQAFFENIIDLRLKAFKDRYERIKKIFSAISQSGKRSSTFELVCLLKDETDIQDCIQFAVDIDFLAVKDNYIYFTHPIIERYIASIYQKQKVSFYEKLSDCLRKLTPANYERRAFIEKLANRSDESDIYLGLTVISKMRSGSFNQSHLIISQISDSFIGNDIKTALHQFKICYELSIAGNIDETLLEVEQISNTLPKQLLAEKNYLKIDSLAKRVADHPKEEALKLIGEWEDIKAEEPEIWYRLVQSKIILAAELGLLDVAIHAETEIVKYFSTRLSFDVSARSILERLNIFSEVIYSPEVAHRKMLQTEKWLSAQLVNENYHKVLDLYLSRTNISSNSIIIDDLPKAIQYAESAIALTEEFPEIQFPCLEAPLNNLYLAVLWQDIENLTWVNEKFQDLYSDATVEENKMLIDINYAGILLLNNQLEKALEVLEHCNYIPDLSNDNSYYCYYYWVNYCVLMFLSGRNQEALFKVNQLKEISMKVSPILKDYYLEHFKLLKEIIRDSSCKTYPDIEVYVNKEMPIFKSKIWKRLKTIYLFTDMQIWNMS